MAKPKTAIKYIEQKTNGKENLHDSGPAVIAEVEVSRTGRSFRHKNKTFQRLKGGGIYGNYVCIETGDEYWISGVKKRDSNRHWAGSGRITVEVPLDRLP